MLRWLLLTVQHLQQHSLGWTKAHYLSDCLQVSVKGPHGCFQLADAIILHQGGLLPWLDTFARVHPWLRAALVAAIAPALWRSQRRWCAPFLGVELGLAAYEWRYPVLSALANDRSSFLWSFAPLALIMWAARLVDPRADPSAPFRRRPEQRPSATAAGSTRRPIAHCRRSISAGP